MEKIKNFLNWRRLTGIAVQALFVGLWFYFVSQHEVISKEGYQYSKYNGIYFLCGLTSLACAWDNLSRGLSLSRRNGVIASVASGGFAAATVLANYPTYERMFVGGGAAALA